MIEVLEHTASDLGVLRERFRVLSKGGHLVLFVPNQLYPFESHPCYFVSLSKNATNTLQNTSEGLLAIGKRNAL